MVIGWLPRPITPGQARMLWTAFLSCVMVSRMATRTTDVTVQTKITRADYRRLTKEIERWRLVNPGIEYTRSSILRMAMLTWLRDSEAMVERADMSKRRAS